MREGYSNVSDRLYSDRYVAMLKQDILALGRYLREIYSLGGNQVHYHVKSVQALKEASEGMIPQFEKALTQCVYAAQTDSSKVSTGDFTCSGS